MSPGKQLFFHLAWAYKGAQKVVVAKHTLKSPQGHSSFLAREGAFWPPLSQGRGTPWFTPRGSSHTLPGNHRAGKKSSAHPTNLRLIYARRLLRHKCRSLHRVCPWVPQQTRCFWGSPSRHGMVGMDTPAVPAAEDTAAFS